MALFHSQTSFSGADQTKNRLAAINRILYVCFTLTGILSWTLGGDKGNALAQLGIALAFDPFNPQQPFGQRPLFQKSLLILHLGVVLAGFTRQFLF